MEKVHPKVKRKYKNKNKKGKETFSRKSSP